MLKLQTAERVSESDKSDNYVYQRSLLAYIEAAKIIQGKVLEIGTGTGYGIELLSANCSLLVTIDKSAVPIDVNLKYDKIKFIRMRAPRLNGFEDGYFDCVVSFQVIEHIRNDGLFMREIHRVLKPGGKLIVTTPNRHMSLTRNPFHVREYTVEELRKLFIKNQYQLVQAAGVQGDREVMRYYELNREKVTQILKFDFLKLNKWLPRILLRMPYDIFNRISRKALSNSGENITKDSYFMGAPTAQSFDWFMVGEKRK